MLPEGTYRLAKNKIVVTNDKKFNPQSLVPYLKQRENASGIFGWKPMLLLYNTQNGKGGGWDKLVQKLGDPPVVFEEGLVQPTERNLKGHLDYIGYYNSTVESEINYKGREAFVTYKVTLGNRITVDSVAFELPENEEFRNAFLAHSSHVTIHKGSFLSEEALSQEAARSSEYLRTQGYYGFSKTHFLFEADTLTRPGHALLTLRINEYSSGENADSVSSSIEKFRFGPVNIDYPKRLKFRESVLRGLNTIKPGEIYNEKAVNNTYSRLSQVPLFSSVNIETSVGEDGRVHSNIKLSQSRLQGIKLGLEASANANWLFSVSPQITYFHKNIFGGGEVLNFSLMTKHQFMFKSDVASNEVVVGVGLRFPKFVFLPYSAFPGRMPHTDIKLSFSYQRRPEFERILFSGSFGYVGTVGDYFSYQFNPLQLNLVRVPFLDPTFVQKMSANPFLIYSFSEQIDLGMGGTLLYKTNPAINPKTSYFWSRLHFNLSGNLVSLFNSLMPFAPDDGTGYPRRLLFGMPYSQYVRAEWSVGQVFRFGRDDRQAVALRFLIGAGVGYGNSSTMPFDKMFYAGGANSMRGWQVRTLGPGTAQPYAYFVVPSQVAAAKVEFNAEYRFPIFWKFEGAAFVDVGNIYEIFTKTHEQFFVLDTAAAFSFDHLESLAANWGLGLRLDLDFLLLRLDVGFRFHDPVREKKWLGFKEMFSANGCAIHFGIGYPF